MQGIFQAFLDKISKTQGEKTEDCKNLLNFAQKLKLKAFPHFEPTETQKMHAEKLKGR